MQDKLVRYLLDSTGVNADNLVRDEEHILSKNKIRAAAPLYGAFFSNSVKLFDKINRRFLNYGVDFCTAGLLQNETMIYNQAISSVILVLNNDVSSNILITYQTLGGDFERNTIGLETLLKNDKPDNDNTLFNDIVKLPTVFKPTFHKHDFGDVYGLDYLVFLLEKIKVAVIWKKTELINSIIDYINDYLSQLTKDISNNADDVFSNLLIDFKNKFNKIVYGLSLVKNIDIITDTEIKAIYHNTEYNKTIDGYLTLKGITILKEELYSTAVSSKKTNLGKLHGSFILPNLTSLANCVVGASFLLNSYNINKIDNLVISLNIYPDLNKTNTLWSIKKITGNLNNVGGLFMATSLNDLNTYIGKLTINSLNELTITWKALLNSSNLDFLDHINQHINDKANPHQDHKSRIKLGNVENLDITSKEEIVCNMPVRSYVTFENLMLYMKRFMTGEKSLNDIELTENAINTQRRMQAIFSPCGPCNTDKKEWELVQDCMVMAPPEKIPNAILETDKTLINSSVDSATLTSYLEDFRPNREVIIKVYRRVVDYVDPEVTTAPPTLPPPVASSYIGTWLNCPNNEDICGGSFMTFNVGNSKIIKPLNEHIRTAVVMDNLGNTIINDVTWSMDIGDITYIDSNIKQIVRQLVETDGVYIFNTPIVNIKPGVLDDFAVRGMYVEADAIAATRKIRLSAFRNGEYLNTIFYDQDIRIQIKNS